MTVFHAHLSGRDEGKGGWGSNLRSWPGIPSFHYHQRSLLSNSANISKRGKYRRLSLQNVLPTKWEWMHIKSDVTRLLIQIEMTIFGPGFLLFFCFPFRAEEQEVHACQKLSHGSRGNCLKAPGKSGWEGTTKEQEECPTLSVRGRKKSMTIKTRVENGWSKDLSLFLSDWETKFWHRCSAN